MAVESQLRPQGLGEGGWPTTRLLQLATQQRQQPQQQPGGGAAAGGSGGDGGAGSYGHGSEGLLLRYLPANPNPSNTNSAIHFLCQVRSCPRGAGAR